MSKQWKELFLCQQSAAFQRELSALRRGFNRIEPHQQRCQEWIGRRWIICFEDLMPQRGWLALGNGEGQENFPRERWKWCRQELCTPSHPFSSITPLTCSSSGWPQLPGPAHHYHHSLLLPPLSATKFSRCRSSWFQQNQEIVNWIPSSSLPGRTQCRKGSTSYHCSMRGDCLTNWNRCLIDAG